MNELIDFDIRIIHRHFWGDILKETMWRKGMVDTRTVSGFILYTTKPNGSTLLYPEKAKWTKL